MHRYTVERAPIFDCGDLDLISISLIRFPHVIT